MKKVTIIGAGLAGSEAAWQLVKRGIAVRLYEMRPQRMTAAHKTGLFAELVCSNSFRGRDLSNAVGLLKEELCLLDSLIMRCAKAAEVPAGGAFAVDRERFSQGVDNTLRNHPLVEVVEAEVRELPAASINEPLIIASGPLSSPALVKEILKLTGHESLAFYDAISPIVLYDSLNTEKIFRQSRYNKGAGNEYLNIPLTEEQYKKFVSDIRKAEKYSGNPAVESERLDNIRPFEGCMPIEDMVERGEDTLRYGPLKPVGLTDPVTGKQPYAVIQLRQDNREGTLWSMVGMQTRMKRADQKRIFTSLPGLEKAEFVRFGSVHRNTFIDSPRCLNATLQLRTNPAVFFAGQITGTEGYVESTAGGVVAGINAGRLAYGLKPLVFPAETAVGALLAYISDPDRENFQPMNISFGLIPAYSRLAGSRRGGRKIPKKERRIMVAQNALQLMKNFLVTQLELERVDYQAADG
ncbi:MAG: methylenetetrahydrofolate--tRNA-(uracil(54)-C(5))-methyltransferase (FADH(2)-oxidizing) TrmFO [Candidatus Dadabacteria bacterium]|nr:MAG: methylenetetrahydrofolate--tRNA-(uracil(54)-C(5))-methyltransferase (FADH(2)-oxidizing) TrmFO [Candidatus Dadabacteria bacterium]